MCPAYLKAKGKVKVENISRNDTVMFCAPVALTSTFRISWDLNLKASCSKATNAKSIKLSELFVQSGHECPPLQLFIDRRKISSENNEDCENSSPWSWYWWSHSGRRNSLATRGEDNLKIFLVSDCLWSVDLLEILFITPSKNVVGHFDLGKKHKQTLKL